jgi:hypothetical protein
MSNVMRMVFFALFACVLALAAGIRGNNVFAQEEGREKKVVVSTFGGPELASLGGPEWSTDDPIPAGRKKCALPQSLQRSLWTRYVVRRSSDLKR